jgi:predicted nucleotidyltransferase
MQLALEDLLKKKVDLVSTKALSKHIAPLIEKDKRLIYEK